MILAMSKGKKPIECVATIGAFDGVHRGHRYLLRRVLAASEKTGLPSVLITFWPLPSCVLGKNKYGVLTSTDQKIELVTGIGIDRFLVLKTERRLLGLSGEQFFRNISRSLRIRRLIVGEDFRFGRDAKSSAASLKKMSDDFGFDVTVIKKRKLRHHIVSSSYVRTLISRGDVKEVRRFLARSYTVCGRRISGRGIGREIGFPTVNLDISPFVIPKPGVYAVRFSSGKTSFLGAGSVGYNPTVKGNSQAVTEVHILKYHNQNLKKHLFVEFLERIRPQKRFSSLISLQKAIKNDIEKVILPKYSR